MSDVAIPGMAAILRLFSDGCSHSRKQIERAIRESPRTIHALLNELLARGLLAQQGSASAPVYTLTLQGRVIVVFDLTAYLRRLPGTRATFVNIQPTFFDLFDGSIPKGALSQFDMARSNYALEQVHADLRVVRRELRQFMIDFIWMSSTLEGNTYTLNEVKHLLVKGVPSIERSPTETIMLINHKKAFDHIWRNHNDYRQLTWGKLADLHQILATDLKIPIGLREKAVGIVDTVYTPPATTAQLRHYLDIVLDRITVSKNQQRRP